MAEYLKTVRRSVKIVRVINNENPNFISDISVCISILLDAWHGRWNVLRSYSAVCQDADP